MKGRDIFSELQEAMAVWGEFNAGNKTLRTHNNSAKPLTMAPDEVKAVREKLKLSQAVFAQYLHTSVTTCRTGSMDWLNLISKPSCL